MKSCDNCPWTEAHRPHITEVSKKAALEGAWFVCIEDYGKCKGVDWYVKENKRNKERAEKNKEKSQNSYNNLFSLTGGCRVGALTDGDETRTGILNRIARDVY